MPTILTDTQRIEYMQQTLPAWFAIHQRPLPWRQTYAPYAVWVSEIMLQQTQMERGVAYFTRWMERFPDISSVAQASEEEVLKLWEGLGYYSRARHLHRAAQHIVNKHAGVFPADVAAIRALPGVGPYTAGAIASIAFNHPLPCVDANVTRILTRVFDIDNPVTQEPASSRIHELALALVPHSNAREHNQAMMELGALICRKKPLCTTCPLQQICESFRLKITHERPVPGKKAAITPLQVVTGVLCSDDKIFVQKRLPQGVWGGLWEFPGGRIEKGEQPREAIVREYMEETGFAVNIDATLGIIRHGYTTYRITLHCFLVSLADRAKTPPPPVLTAASQWQWATLDEIGRMPLPAAHRKLADILSTL